MTFNEFDFNLNAIKQQKTDLFETIKMIDDNYQFPPEAVVCTIQGYSLVNVMVDNMQKLKTNFEKSDYLYPLKTTQKVTVNLITNEGKTVTKTDYFYFDDFNLNFIKFPYQDAKKEEIEEKEIITDNLFDIVMQKYSSVLNEMYHVVTLEQIGPHSIFASLSKTDVQKKTCIGYTKFNGSILLESGTIKASGEFTKTSHKPIFNEFIKAWPHHLLNTTKKEHVEVKPIEEVPSVENLYEKVKNKYELSNAGAGELNVELDTANDIKVNAYTSASTKNIIFHKQTISTGVTICGGVIKTTGKIVYAYIDNKDLHELNKWPHKFLNEKEEKPKNSMPTIGYTWPDEAIPPIKQSFAPTPVDPYQPNGHVAWTDGTSHISAAGWYTPADKAYQYFANEDTVDTNPWLDLNKDDDSNVSAINASGYKVTNSWELLKTAIENTSEPIKNFKSSFWFDGHTDNQKTEVKAVPLDKNGNKSEEKTKTGYFFKGNCTKWHEVDDKSTLINSFDHEHKWHFGKEPFTDCDHQYNRAYPCFTQSEMEVTIETIKKNKTNEDPQKLHIFNQYGQIEDIWESQTILIGGLPFHYKSNIGIWFPAYSFDEAVFVNSSKEHSNVVTKFKKKMFVGCVAASHSAWHHSSVVVEPQVSSEHPWATGGSTAQVVPPKKDMSNEYQMADYTFSNYCGFFEMIYDYDFITIKNKFASFHKCLVNDMSVAQKKNDKKIFNKYLKALDRMQEAYQKAEQHYIDGIEKPGMKIKANHKCEDLYRYLKPDNHGTFYN